MVQKICVQKTGHPKNRLSKKKLSKRQILQKRRKNITVKKGHWEKRILFRVCFKNSHDKWTPKHFLGHWSTQIWRCKFHYFGLSVAHKLLSQDAVVGFSLAMECYTNCTGLNGKSSLSFLLSLPFTIISFSSSPFWFSSLSFIKTNPYPLTFIVFIFIL